MTTEQMDKLETILELLNRRITRAEKDLVYTNGHMQTWHQGRLNAYTEMKEDLLFFFDELNK